MKLCRVKYAVIVMLLSLLFVGCGKSDKGLVGTWENKKDKITFNEDGSFNAYYYFTPGQWQEFGEGKVNIIQSLIGTERYFYEISDEGVLVLTYCYESDGEWKKGDTVYKFVREGKDLSLLDNISSSTEAVEEESKKQEDVSLTEENSDASNDSSSSEASVEEELPAFSFDIEMDDPVEAFGIDTTANEDTKHYYSWYGCYYTGTKFSFYYPQEYFNKVVKMDSLYPDVQSTNTLAYKFTGVNDSELLVAVIEYDNPDSFNAYLSKLEAGVYESENNLIEGSDPDGQYIRFWGYDSESKDNIVYYIVRVEADKAYILETTVPNYTDQNDKTRRDYYLECMYRGCGFSDSPDDIRGCWTYYEEHPEDKEFEIMISADVINNAVGEDSLSGPFVITNVDGFDFWEYRRRLFNLRTCVEEESTSQTTASDVETAKATKYSEDDAVRILKLIIKTAENVDVEDENMEFSYEIENGVLSFIVLSANKDGDHPMTVCSGDADLNSGIVSYYSNIYGFDKEFLLGDYLN